MHARVRAYLAHRRKLGFILSRQGYHLREFAAFADKTARGQPLTTALALQWATSVGHNRYGYHAMRYQSVRGLARYLAALDPHTEVPSARMLGSTCIRRQPHIYTPEQVRLMMKQSRQLPHRARYEALRPQTFETMIGLVFCRSSAGRGVQVAARRLRPSGAHDSNHPNQVQSAADLAITFDRRACAGTLPKGETADHSVRRSFLRRPSRGPFHAQNDSRLFPLRRPWDRAQRRAARCSLWGSATHFCHPIDFCLEPPRRTGAALLGAAVALHGAQTIQRHLVVCIA